MLLGDSTQVFISCYQSVTIHNCCFGDKRILGVIAFTVIQRIQCRL